MFISDFSVKHPVVATVISLLLVVFGIIALERLALREYPDIDPPVVSVETAYPGAAAKTVENRVTKIIEDRISGIEGIRYIEAQSEDGLSTITIEFNLSRNIDNAANDVRERVSRVVSDLPDGIDPPEIFKVDSDQDVIMWLNLSSNKMNALQLTDYADRYLVDKLATLDGVARVRIGGEKRYAMRIWLNRKAMAAKGVTVSDINEALQAYNVELPGGRIESKDREFTVWIQRKYEAAKDFENLVIRTQSGHFLRLKEVAKVSVGAENRRTELRGNKIDMIGLGVVKQSKANTLAVSDAVKAEVKKLQQSLPPGMKLVESYDTSLFIHAAIQEVYKTFAVVLVLVVLVIFIFLGKFRLVLIPAITVPIALLASFIVLYLFNYSVNLLTLLALVLAIGLVVDDAIVVVENIVRKIQGGEKPLAASFLGTRQVGFAVVATTLVLLAVFLPITLLTGNVGRLFTEFSVTVSAAVVFSSFVALTLTPVLCSILIKKQNKQSGFANAIDRSMENINRVYEKGLKFLLKHRIWVVFSFLFIGVIAVVLYRQIPEELVPAEDQGAFFILVDGPEGASFSYMQNYMRQIEDLTMPLVKDNQANRVLSIIPRGFGSSDPVNTAFAIVVMKHWDERDKDTQTSVNQLAPKLQQLPGVRTVPFIRQSIGNSGLNQKVQFVIGDVSFEKLEKWQEIIIAATQKNPGLLNVDSDYKPTKPQLVVDINTNRAHALGVSIRTIGTTLETMLGSRDVTTFIDNDEEYEVILEADLKQKVTPQDLNNIYVRSETTRELIPLANLVSLKEIAVANSLNRFNRIKTITISASLAPGYSLGQALNFLETTVKKNLPPEVTIDYKGESRDFKEANVEIYFTFLLALIVMYLILSAQFGSFIHPLVIMVTVPFALTGALFGLWLFNNTLNIYSQIGIIMLTGLAAKNAILIIEFINQLREEGVSFTKAVIKGSLIRLRPVLMTAISTILGALPLIFAMGAGANSRISIGLVIFFGVSFATFMTLFVIPVFYHLFARSTKARNATEKALEAELNDKTPTISS